MRDTCAGNQSQVRGIWEMKSEWELILRWGFPLVVIGGSHSGWIRDRAPPPIERLLTWRGNRRRGPPRGLGAGLSRWSRWKSAVRDGFKMSSALTHDRSSGPYPSQSTRYCSILPRRREVQNLTDLIRLLAKYNEGRGSLVTSLLLDLLSSRTTSGLEQGDMKSGWDMIMGR